MTPEQTLTEMARLVDTGADRLNSLQTTAHRTDQPYPAFNLCSKRQALLFYQDFCSNASIRCRRCSFSALSSFAASIRAAVRPV